MSAGEVGNRLWRRSLHQLVLKGITRGSAARGDTELAVDGTQVRVNGVQTQHQLFSDLRVSQSRCEQAEHLELAYRQTTRRGG